MGGIRWDTRLARAKPPATAGRTPGLRGPSARCPAVIRHDRIGHHQFPDMSLFGVRGFVRADLLAQS